MTKKILVCSGKGGVGKTTITAYLGKVLSKNYNVALFDLDIAGPNLPIILGMKNDLHVDVDLDHMYPKRFENMEIFSSAFLIPAGVACTWDGSKRMRLVQELVNKVKWSPFDYMLIDLLPGSGDELVAAIQLIPDITGAIIVANGTAECISDAKRLVSMLQNKMFDVPILGVVENMSFILQKDKDSKSEKKVPLFSSGINIESELGIPVLDTIPHKKLSKNDFNKLKNVVIKIIEQIDSIEIPRDQDIQETSEVSEEVSTTA